MVERFADLSGGLLGMATGFNPTEKNMGIDKSNMFGAVGAATGANEAFEENKLISGLLPNFFG